ncbi:MAG: TonB-dependent receptor [Bacteroidota bacterium]
MRALYLFLTACLALPALAQTAPPDTTLPAVSVSAARVTLPLAEAPARVTVLDAEDVTASGAQTVADLLEDRSAMFVKRYGPGGLASFALRGSGASHTLVLLDGHRIADPQLGQLDASLLPASLLESVEVLHGPASALYGTDAVGGVVSIRSPQPGRIFARATASGGAFGERRASALASGRIGASPVFATVAFEHAQAQNDYPYTDSTAFNPETGASGVTRDRENTDLARDAVFARFAGEVGRHRAAAGVLFTDADRGLFDYSAAQAARQEDRAFRLWADHTLRLGSWRVHTGGLWQRTALRYVNPTLGLDDTGRTGGRSLRLRAERGWAAGADETWHLSLGGHLGQARAEHPNLAGDAEEQAASLFGSFVVRNARGVLTTALRFDRSETASVDSLALPDSAVQALTPHAGINLQPTPWRGFRLKASAGRAFRTPTFNDRFWQPGGNPALRPERGWTAEAGAVVEVRPGPLTFATEGTLFTSRLRDQIVWRPGRFPDGFYWAPVNVGRTRTTGWELSANVRFEQRSAFAEVGGLWARSRARDRTDSAATSFDQPLLFVPDDQAKAHVALGLGPLRLDAQLRHASERPSAADGSAALDPYTLFDAGASVALAGPAWRARLGARVENLTDEVYSVVPRYPMPPRTLRLTLTLETR